MKNSSDYIITVASFVFLLTFITIAFKADLDRKPNDFFDYNTNYYTQRNSNKGTSYDESENKEIGQINQENYLYKLNLKSEIYNLRPSEYYITDLKSIQTKKYIRKENLNGKNNYEWYSNEYYYDKYEKTIKVRKVKSAFKNDNDFITDIYNNIGDKNKQLNNGYYYSNNSIYNYKNNTPSSNTISIPSSSYYYPNYSNLYGNGINTNPQHVHVSGYYKSNGTYVSSYIRTAANNTILDNFSTNPNVNPYSGKVGTVKIK